MPKTPSPSRVPRAPHALLLCLGLRLRLGLILLLLVLMAELRSAYAVPQEWSLEVSSTRPYQFTAYHGETLELAASFTHNGAPWQLSGDYALFWQTNGMTGYWTAPASVVSNRVSATFTGAMDPGAPIVYGFLGSTGSNYRAAFACRFQSSPGAAPNSLPLPVRTLDFSQVEVLNAPWATTNELSTLNSQLSTSIASATNATTQALMAELGSATNAITSNLSTNYYTKAETDERIIALAPAPGDYANVSNRAVNALSRAEAEAGFTEWIVEPSTYQGRPIIVATSLTDSVYEPGDPGSFPHIGYWCIFYTDDTTRDFAQSIAAPQPPGDYTYLHWSAYDSWGNGVTATRTRLPTMADLYSNAVAATNYADSVVTNYLPLTGGTMSGDLTFDDGATAFPVTVSALADDECTGGLAWRWGGSTHGYFAPVAGMLWEWMFEGKYFTLPLSKGGSSRLNAAELAVLPDIAVAASAATNYTNSATSNITAVVATWENFLDGSNVVFSITNYISGTYNLDAAKLRILELKDGEYREVYNSRDEILTHIAYFKTNDFAVATNQVIGAVNAAIADKADRAWGKYSSSGQLLEEVSVSNTVYMTAPNTVFAGGLEYERVAVGEGSVCVLTTRGAPVWSLGDEGTFKFQDDGGTNYFGFAKTDRYTVGANTDGIAVQSGLVTLTYNITMSGRPCVWYASELSANTTWEQLNLSDGSAVPGATYTVAWESDPEPNTQVCYINVGSSPQGFFKATIEVAGYAKFMTNMAADLSGGILCTDGQHKVRPVYSNGSVTWEVMQ